MKKTASVFLLLSVLSVPALAQQTMPPPRAMPRIPVSRQTLAEQKAAPTRLVQGQAAIIDGEKLRIADTDLRLFGIVPPQLAASFGPQARSTLDSIANGQNVTCQVRDRDRDGRLLATCRTSTGTDMALELLRRGLAVTARGSITGADIATAYLSAEQAAQNQKIGLWSVTGAPPVSFSATGTTPQPAYITLPEKVAPRADKSSDKLFADAQAAPMSIPASPPPSETQAKIAADLVDQHTQSRLDEDRWQQPLPDANAGFFERYQILIAGFLMLATAVTIIAALWTQKRRDKRDEAKAVAAALRGELMAARGVCIGRLKSMTSEEEDRASTWPRIRSTLYQAYVGRLGLLGAELARQVASIYGQSSDYSSLYSPNGTAHDGLKKQALETLVRHIDEVLPKLAGIEHTGATPPVLFYQSPRSHYDSPRLGSSAPQRPVLQASYKTIAAPGEKKPESPAQESVASYEQVPAAAKPVSEAPAAPKPTALWEAVRGFIQNHRNAIAQTPPSHEEHVSEYAAMIEADMARYPYSENIESFDIAPQKKSG